MESINHMLENIFKHATTQINQSSISVVVAVCFSSAILYLTIQRFLVASGKIEAPLKNTLFKLVALITIYVIATDGYWLVPIERLEAMDVGTYLPLKKWLSKYIGEQKI